MQHGELFHVEQFGDHVDIFLQELTGAAEVQTPGWTMKLSNLGYPIC